MYIFRADPPALLELSPAGEVMGETAVTVPGGCRVENLFGPPQGSTLAMELGCSFGQAVLWVNTDTGEEKQPVAGSDSHFLAWAEDGQSAYLRVDSMNRPRIVRVPLTGGAGFVPITELAYDLSPMPGSDGDFLFSFSRGMGQGSEMWLARHDGRLVKRIAGDPYSYLSFARWSPDGTNISFIKILDSATPFTIGELWIMRSDGSQARKLADADAGHGFAEAWSPDGRKIAFVVRENPGDGRADQDAHALQSSIAVVKVDGGPPERVTQFQGARVEAPAWSLDGSRLAFTAILDDKINVYLADLESGNIQQAAPVSSCCPVWMLK